MKIKTIILLGILFFFLALFIHNAWYYPPKAGYDSFIHYFYTRILIFENRIPIPKDTPESYNPPLFYFLSGKLAQIFMPFFKKDLFDALKSWQILMALVLPVAGYLWFDIFRYLNPKNKNFAYLFLIWLLSLPVLNKMLPMYNIEIFQMIQTTLVLWFFIKYFLPKPTINKTIILGFFCGFLLLTRIMSALLLTSLGLFIILLWRWQKISFKKMLAINIIFAIFTLLIGGWYYYFYKDYGVFDSGENIKEFEGIPLLKRQPKSFYFDTFFRTMMKTPIRPYFPNRFIPIFYSDFWGDYWNYFRQRRYPLTEKEEKQFKNNKEKISSVRLKMLAWQNRINLIPTIIIIIGFFIYFLKTLFLFIKRVKLSHVQLSESFFALFFNVVFLGFLYTNFKFPNLYKGDTVKASYILFTIPILIYFATKIFIKIKNRRLIFYFLLISLLISFLFNLRFDFY